MTYVFCDIEGTYNILSDDEKEQLIKIISKLDKTVYFSFISSADIEYVKDYYEDFLEYNNKKNIKPLAQIGCYNYINEKKEIVPNPCEVSKGIKMIYFQNSLELSGVKINKVIYIDDNANLFPLIYTMDNEINKRIREKDLEFIVIEKINKAENYCKDSMDLNEVKFISNNKTNFIIEGLKECI